MIDKDFKEKTREAIDEYQKMVNVGFEIPEKQRIIFEVAEKYLAGEIVPKMSKEEIAGVLWKYFTETNVESTFNGKIDCVGLAEALYKSMAKEER